MNTVCGFVVLRKPNQNYDKEGRGAFLSSPPCIDEICYSGIDRMPWFELDEDLYSGTLSQEFVALRDKIQKKNDDFTDIKLLTDLDEVRSILNYSNWITERNEIAVVFSEKLAEIKGTINTDMKVVWLGLDIYCPGYGSQLREGIFSKPELFSGFVKQLNPNGLFDIDSPVLADYVQMYRELSDAHNLEPIDSKMVGQIDTIKIGKLD